MRGHFWPFTGVLGRILRFVTGKNRNSKNHGSAYAKGSGATGCTDIADKGRSRKQKETKVANVVPNQVRSESSLLSSLSSLRKIASGERISRGR
jgi:hypothetical protein